MADELLNIWQFVDKFIKASNANLALPQRFMQTLRFKSIEYIPTDPGPATSHLGSSPTKHLLRSVSSFCNAYSMCPRKIVPLQI